MPERGWRLFLIVQINHLQHMHLRTQKAFPHPQKPFESDVDEVECYATRRPSVSELNANNGG